MISIVNDGWKGAKKEKLDGMCTNVDFNVSAVAMLIKLMIHLPFVDSLSLLNSTRPLHRTKMALEWLTTMQG
jgi:hypothetical protein